MNAEQYGNITNTILSNIVEKIVTQPNYYNVLGCQQGRAFLAIEKTELTTPNAYKNRETIPIQIMEQNVNTHANETHEDINCNSAGSTG